MPRLKSFSLLLLAAAASEEETCKVSMLQTSVNLGRTASLPEKDQIYNVHIPKSAGSSFALDVQDILRPLHLISQEGCLSLHRSNPRLKGAITMLREPRAHVLSQYKMCRSQWVEEFRQATRQKGQHVLPHRFENWVEAWERIREEGWHGDFTPSANLESQNDIELKIRETRMEAWGQPPYSIDNGTKLRMEDWPSLDGGGTVWHFTRVPFQCYAPINLQSQRLSCQKPLRYESEIDKELLIENVNSLWFVGFAEAYQSSICLLHWRFSRTLPPFCDCNSELWHSFQGHSENQNSTYHGEVKLSQLGRKVLKKIVHFPFRVWKIVKKIQGRLIRELEKKFNRKHVVLVANRTILDKNFRRKGLKVRPRSRTLTAVHESILEDLVGPTEIVGKRTRISLDGSKLLKIILDPKDKDKENIESKLPAFAAVYKKLTNKEAQFMFPTV